MTQTPARATIVGISIVVIVVPFLTRLIFGSFVTHMIVITDVVCILMLLVIHKTRFPRATKTSLRS